MWIRVTVSKKKKIMKEQRKKERCKNKKLKEKFQYLSMKLLSPRKKKVRKAVTFLDGTYSFIKSKKTWKKGFYISRWNPFFPQEKKTLKERFQHLSMEPLFSLRWKKYNKGFKISRWNLLVTQEK